MWFVFILFACRASPPSITGIPDDPLLSEQKSAAEMRKKKPKIKQARFYSKRPEVVVDVSYFGGNDFIEAQPYLIEQLGAQLSKRSLSPKEGESRMYERGEIRLFEGVIYMIRFELPTPMRRSSALPAAGLPEQVDDYIITHREYQLTYQWEFRRIRMKRQDKSNELVTNFEAWKWIPQERANR
ncbi:MAG: hypothetical protein VX278_09165 [Myxococcota bacterium]|nr:hypothetical protein [Myxococcota bacterium]